MKGLLLNCTVILALLLGILIVLGGNRTPGGLSDENYSEQWKLYPVWSVGSYKQKTNNIKYWPQPCNGTAAPADVCGGLYKKIIPEDRCTPPPQRNCRRVNYYCN